MRQRAVAELPRQVVGRGVGRDFLIFQLVEPQDVGNHRAQAFAGGGDGRGVFPLLRLAQTAARQRGGIAVHNGQRRSDFVGHVGDEIVFHRLRAAQLLHHAVEVLAHDIHIIKLVRVVKRLDADGEIALRHLPHRAAERAHRPIKPAAGIQMKHDCRQKRHRNPV